MFGGFYFAQAYFADGAPQTGTSQVTAAPTGLPGTVVNVAPSPH